MVGDPAERRTQTMAENDWRGGKQERRRLYWKVREERKRALREKYERLKPRLGEKGRRLWAANEALAWGRGGVRAVAAALGMSTKTILDGKKELQREPPPGGRWGGGRARASARGWTEIGSGETSGMARRHRADRGPGHTGGPDRSSEMDLQKLKSHRERAELTRLFRQYHHGEQGVAGGAGI